MMYKNLLALLMLFLTMVSNSQDIVLLKNFNPKAKVLQHHLNKTRDSLILDCSQSIIKVDLFNGDFEKTVEVNNSKVNITLNDIPVGEFMIEVQLDDRTIIMELIRYDRAKNSSNACDSGELAYEKGTMLDENLNTINVTTTNRIENLLSPRKRTAKKKFFWVILKISNAPGSAKTMKLVDETIAKKLIQKNKLESNNATRKFNELIVWEVYDSSKFMQAQLADPNYINSTTSDLFNVIPYYTTTKNLVAVK
ncbi:hypothetical protein [Winogradskyella sp.]|uniref:hypothetical protein n=1 Tax=Winogradskyella sp. TaxID=1883156 RepID=UPI003BAA6847